MAVYGGSRGGIVSSVTGAIKDAAGWVGNKVGGGVETVTRYVDKFYHHLKEELSGVTSYFKQGYNSVVDAANAAWHKSVDAVQKPDGIINTAIAKAQAMASAATDKLDTMTDLVKALTNWTIGFVIGLIQGTFTAVKYGIEKGFAPLQGFFHAVAAGSYEAGKRLFAMPGDFFNGFWNGVNNISMVFGPFAPLFTAVVIFVMVASMIWIAKVVPPWVIARVAERG